MAIKTAAAALGQTGISIPAAVTLILNINLRSWAVARKIRKKPTVKEAGRFMI